MKGMNDMAVPIYPLAERPEGDEWREGEETAGTVETTPGGDEEVQWEVVARVRG
jgi:hypothetical protein